MGVTRKQSMNPKERFVAAVLSLEGVTQVDAVIRQKLKSDAPLLHEIPAYLFELGGKRVRPLLTLLVARAVTCASPPESVIDVAAGIELIHMATLLHDDIIDNSPVRRHQSSPFVKYGATNTLLAGDFLLVRAFALCAHLDEFIIDATERACIDLTEGEIMEMDLATRAHTRESSIDIARRKTGSLFRLATESGAHLSGSDTARTALFSHFGETLGIAFQIIDDVLDVTSNEEQLGKRPGTDIRERKPSLVNMLWLASGNESATRLLSTPGLVATDVEIAAALEELRGSPVITDAIVIAREFAQKARSALESALAGNTTADATAVDGLHALIDYAVERLE